MQKFFLFLVSGCMVYVINIGGTYFQSEMLGLPQYLSYLSSLILSMSFGLFFSFRYTFKTKFSREVLYKYLTALLLLTFLNYISVGILTRLVSSEAFYIFIFIMTTIIFFLKFFVYDRFVFTSSK